MDKAHIEPSTPALKSLHPRASRKQTHQNPRNAMVSTYVTKSKGHGAKRLGSDEGGEGKSWIGGQERMHQDVGSNQMESGGAIKLSAEESPYGKEPVAANCGPEVSTAVL